MPTEQFPYVKRCPDCHGSGLKAVYTSEDKRHGIASWCAACDGRGRIIPPEWTQQ